MIVTVKDSSGAALPGVQIHVTNKETGDTFVALADSSGKYEAPVPPGNYHVTATLPGFTTQQQDTTLTPGRLQALDFSFKLKM